MFKRLKTFLLPVAILAAVFGGVSAHAMTLPETRVGGYQIVDAASRLAAPSQVLESQQASNFSWYDTASECSVAAESTAAETRMTTVLGSGRDVAPYANRPGFNVLNMDNLPASEWPRQNALWLNQAIRRGDDIWLLTDPAKHTQLMQQLGKSSYYLDLELPMLQQYNGVNAIPKYITSP